MKSFEIKKWNGKNIIIYGAGTIGQEFYHYLERQQIDLSAVAFCDKLYLEKNMPNNKLFLSKELVILNPENLESHRDDNFCIASTSFANEMYEHLKKSGVQRIYALPDELFFAGFQSEGNRYKTIIETLDTRQGIVLSALDLCVTDVCTLRCKECVALMPYYKHPKPEIESVMYKSFDRLLSVVEKIGSVSIMGGEPFCNENLLQKVLYRYMSNKKIGSFNIITNGTLLPNSESLEAMKAAKAVVIFSDYGRLSNKMEAAIELLEKSGISYDVQNDDRAPWYQQGELKDYCRTANEDQKMYYECNWRGGCNRLYHGEFHLCTRSSNGTYLGVIPKIEGEYIDFLDEGKEKEVLEKELHTLLRRKKALVACKYCNRDANVKVKRGEQARGENDGR